jgi:hypothetical protein
MERAYGEQFGHRQILLDVLQERSGETAVGLLFRCRVRVTGVSREHEHVLMRRTR